MVSEGGYTAVAPPPMSSVRTATMAVCASVTRNGFSKSVGERPSPGVTALGKASSSLTVGEWGVVEVCTSMTCNGFSNSFGERPSPGVFALGKALSSWTVGELGVVEDNGILGFIVVRLMCVVRFTCSCQWRVCVVRRVSMR